MYCLFLYFRMIKHQVWTTGIAIIKCTEDFVHEKINLLLHNK
jgi:hypothetical protein